MASIYYSEKGAALIIALIIGVIASALCLFALQTTRNVLYASELLMDKLQAQIQAESALEQLKYLAATEGEIGGSLISGKTSFISILPDPIYVDGRKETKGQITLRVEDSGCKINILYLPTRAIGRLMRLEGLSPDEAAIIRDSLQDWVDKDDLKHLNGAESYYYRNILRVK